MNSNVAFEKINRKKIFTILSEPNGEVAKKIVIMSHGFRGSSIGPARTFVDFGRKLVDAGYSTFRFDEPNSGNSEGNFIDSSFQEWVNTIVYFASNFVKQGYEVALLGQSMGATATMIATNQLLLKGKIPCVILWVPDPEIDFNENPQDIGEEEGEKYRNTFWQEAKNMDFFGCLDAFQGGIHLVYGENDRFVSSALRSRTIDTVKNKGQQFMKLPGQNHSKWDFDVAQKVYEEEIKFLGNYI